MNSPITTQREFLADAAVGVRHLAERVAHVAPQFRGQALHDANINLARLTHEIGQFAALVSAFRASADGNAQRFTISGQSPDEQITRLACWLDLLVDAQGNADWLTVADVLELDLLPLLRAWVERLSEGGRTPDASASTSTGTNSWPAAATGRSTSAGRSTI